MSTHAHTLLITRADIILFNKSMKNAVLGSYNQSGIEWGVLNFPKIIAELESNLHGQCYLIQNILLKTLPFSRKMQLKLKVQDKNSRENSIQCKVQTISLHNETIIHCEKDNVSNSGMLLKPQKFT